MVAGRGAMMFATPRIRGMAENDRLINLPLKQLVVFEAVSHSPTFAQAADTLFMTQSGVSQHIQDLETYLGVRLINRRSKENVLTEDGKYLRTIVTRNLKGLYDAVTFIRTKRGSLKIKSARSFAAKWLLPRLEKFIKQYPSIEAHFALFNKDVMDPQVIEFDVLIMYGDGAWEGYDATPLVHEYLTPLCRPSIRPASLAALGACVLLHPSGERMEWKRWAEHFGVPLDTSSGLTFESMFMALNAATEGVGVTIGDLNLVGGDLQAGTLMMPFPLVYKNPNQYYLVTHPGRENPLAERFREWILQELAENQANVADWEGWSGTP